MDDSFLVLRGDVTEWSDYFETYRLLVLVDDVFLGLVKLSWYIFLI